MKKWAYLSARSFDGEQMKILLPFKIDVSIISTAIRDSEDVTIAGETYEIYYYFDNEKEALKDLLDFIQRFYAWNSNNKFGERVKNFKEWDDKVQEILCEIFEKYESLYPEILI
jgi:hypothetical protein